MKKLLQSKIFALLTIMLLLFSFSLIPTQKAFAESDSTNSSDNSTDTNLVTDTNIQHIYDKAELLSSSELADINELCDKYSKDDNVNIIILTHNDANAVYAETYIEDFYDQTLPGDSVILLVDLYNRDVFIEGYGSAEVSVNSSRIQKIIDKITPDLHNGDYSDAFKQYIQLANKYIHMGPIYQNVFLHLAIAIVIGIIVVAVMAYNAGGKMTAGSSTYIDPNNSGLIGKRDDYIRTQITRVRKPENNSGGGGGGGGVSAGGNSHSSGGGKF